MSVRMKPVLVVLGLLTGVFVATFALGGFRQGADPSLTPQAPVRAQQDQGVWDILCAVPFRVEQEFTHWWRAERPQVRTGYILVLAVDPEVARPRQVAEPVLFVGEQTAERLNGGYPNGALIIVVPTRAGPQGWPAVQLESQPMWFGDAALPEQVDHAEILEQLAKAPRAAVFSGSRVAAALLEGPGPQEFVNQAALHTFAAGLVERFAPGEPHVAAQLRGL